MPTKKQRKRSIRKYANKFVLKESMYEEYAKRDSMHACRRNYGDGKYIDNK